MDYTHSATSPAASVDVVKGSKTLACDVGTWCKLPFESMSGVKLALDVYRHEQTCFVDEALIGDANILDGSLVGHKSRGSKTKKWLEIKGDPLYIIPPSPSEVNPSVMLEAELEGGKKVHSPPYSPP